MIHLVSHYFPRDHVRKQIAALSLDHNACVAKVEGWNFIGDMFRREPKRGVFREKAAMLVHVCQISKPDDMIMWVDGDTLIMTPDPAEIFTILGSSDIAMAKDHYDNWTSGVFAMRCSDKMESGWRGVMLDPKHGDSWKDYPVGLEIAELPAAWNDRYLSDDCKVLHPYGRNSITKLRLMGEALNG